MVAKSGIAGAALKKRFFADYCVEDSCWGQSGKMPTWVSIAKREERRGGNRTRSVSKKGSASGRKNSEVE